MVSKFGCKSFFAHIEHSKKEQEGDEIEHKGFDIECYKAKNRSDKGWNDKKVEQNS